MRKILVINADPTLQRALIRVAAGLRVELQSVDRWGEARQQLVLNHYDLVCLNYDDFRVEGLDSFILLDNILQKEGTPGLLLFGAVSERARQLSGSLASLQDTLEIGNAGPQLEVRLKEMIGSMLAKAGAESSAAQSIGGAGNGASMGAPPADRAMAPIEMEVRLPQYREGDLERTTLTRLLYAIHTHGSTGVLELRQQTMVRRYPFDRGEFVETGDKDPQYADSMTLQSAFAWSRGQFTFEARSQSVPGKAVSTMSLIVAGVEKNLSQRRAMDSLMPLMKTYPVVVSRFWELQKSKISWPVLHAFMGLCAGGQTLEIVLGRMGSDVTAGFLAAYMARDTDLVFFRTEPTSRPVVVSYGAASAATIGNVPGNFGTEKLDEEQERKKTKAYRASTSERKELEQELRVLLESLQHKSLYEIFGVWEGCGRNAVKERFYVLVKEHHPDVYGGNVSDEVKRLAQRIFMKIKDTYAELMKIETVQTVAAPPTGSGRVVDGSGAGKQVPMIEQVHRPRRAPIDTPLATQVAVSSGSVVGQSSGRRNTTPIGLGREPSEMHPESEKHSLHSKDRQDKMEHLAQKATRARTVSAAGLTLPPPPGRLQTPVKTPGLPTSGIRTDVSKSTIELTSAKDFFNEGFLLFRNNQFAEAMVLLTKAYELEPENGLYLTFYGYVLFLTDADRREESEKLLQKALNTQHRQAMPDAHLFLGRVLMVKNELKRAHEHFEYALQLNPSNPDVKRELRLAESRLKEQNEKGGFLRNLFKKERN